MDDNALLLTGGAGCIGSHAARDLREQGHWVIVLDDLSRGFAAATAGCPVDLFE